MDEILKNDQNFVRVLGGVTNDADLDVTMLRVDPITKRLLVSASISGSVVTSLNGLTGAVTLAGGTGITVTPAGQTITISLTSGGEVTSITGTANQIIASASTGAITLSTPQDIATSSTPTFAGLITPTLIGSAASATPSTLSVAGGASRAGTDTNTAGANMIVQAGLGTGTATESSILFKAPVRTTTGSAAQTNQQMMSLSYDNSATFAKLNLGVNNSFQTQLILNGASGTQTLALGTNGVTATINSGSTPLRLTTSDTTNGVSIGSSPLTWVTDNTYDIGASGATRPRSIYVGTNGTFGGSVTALSLQSTTGSSNLSTVSGSVNIGDSNFSPTSYNISDGAVSLSASGSGTATFGRAQFTAGLMIQASADNTYDIGANGANRPRTGYFGTSIVNAAGSATTPSYGFDAGTGGIGMYRIGNGLGLSTGSNGSIGAAVSGNAVSFLGFTGSNSSAAAVFNVTTGSARSGSSAAQVFASLTPTYNQTSTAGATDLLIARTETALGSGAQYLINALAGSAGTTQMFSVTNTGKLTTALGIGLDGNAAPATGIFMSGQLNWNNQIYMDGVATGILRIQNDSGSTGASIDVHTADTFKFRNYAHNADAAVTMSTIGQSGLTVKYNNISTAGWGVPAIYGSGRSTAQVAAVATVATYTVGAADGSFMVSANANITAFVAGTFNVQVAYTDETNTAQTLKLNFASVTGTLGIALAAAGPYEGIPNHIRCKAATAITIATSGTFTSLTYNVECVIQQIS